MNILLPYASSEGHTHKIVERIASLAQANGHGVTVYDTASLVDVPEIDAFDAAVLAASVHETDHQKSIVAFATAHQSQLRTMPSAFVSVSLSAATPDGSAEAQKYVDRFIAATGWTPPRTLLAAGAMDLANCDYFQRQVLTDVLAKCPSIKDDNQNYVFTDWPAIEAFVADFLRDASPKA